VLDYFLHPLNPFRTQVNTSNEVLAMQGIAIGMLMQQGLQGEPLSPIAAEDEYKNALSRLTGEQYELLPPVDPSMYTQPSPLYTIRHVLRTSPTNAKILGIYYVVEGVIYKSPSVRSLMKTNVARVLDEGLSGACQALSVCAQYQPSIGYLWLFEDNAAGGGEETVDPVSLIQLSKRRKRRKILDNRKPGERTAAEEEGIRASEAIDQILVRLSKSPLLTKAPTTASGAGTSSSTLKEPPSASSKQASGSSSNSNTGTPKKPK
jgi:MED6 mediator sub complex component